MVERHSCFGEHAPGDGFVVLVLHREVHLDVSAHGADHVAHRLSEGKPALSSNVGHSIHILVTLVLPGEAPVEGAPFERFSPNDCTALGEGNPRSRSRKGPGKETARATGLFSRLT